jgi:hypothetical protein
MYFPPQLVIERNGLYPVAPETRIDPLVGGVDMWLDWMTVAYGTFRCLR